MESYMRKLLNEAKEDPRLSSIRKELNKMDLDLGATVTSNQTQIVAFPMTDDVDENYFAGSIIVLPKHQKKLTSWNPNAMPDLTDDQISQIEEWMSLLKRSGFDAVNDWDSKDYRQETRIEPVEASEQDVKTLVSDANKAGYKLAYGIWEKNDNVYGGIIATSSSHKGSKFPSGADHITVSFLGGMEEMGSYYSGRDKLSSHKDMVEELVDNPKAFGVVKSWVEKKKQNPSSSIPSERVD